MAAAAVMSVVVPAAAVMSVVVPAAAVMSVVVPAAAVMSVVVPAAAVMSVVVPAAAVMSVVVAMAVVVTAVADRDLSPGRFPQSSMIRCYMYCSLWLWSVFLCLPCIRTMLDKMTEELFLSAMLNTNIRALTHYSCTMYRLDR